MDVGENFSIEMEVMPAPTDHDGNLFAIGSKRKFPYYEWRTKANSTQYLVVEIVYSSVSITQILPMSPFNYYGSLYTTGRAYTEGPGYLQLALD
mgnify:CR=1 FL=1